MATTDRGRRREERCEEWRAARYADVELDSDEEEELAEDVAKYFRPVGKEQEEARVAAVEGLNVVGKPLSLSGKNGGKWSKEEAAQVALLHQAKPEAKGNSIRPSQKRMPVIPFVSTPAKNVVLRLRNEEVEEDLLKMTGRDLAEERKAKAQSPKRAKPPVKGGVKGVAKTKAAPRSRAVPKVKSPTGNSKAAAAAKAAAAKTAAAAKAAAGAKAAAAARAAAASKAAAAAKAEAAAPTGGGSGKKRRFSAVEDEVVAAPRPPPVKKSKSGGRGVGSDTRLFTKHTEKKGWVVCNKCRTAVWPPNCNKHLSHCRKGA